MERIINILVFTAISSMIGIIGGGGIAEAQISQEAPLPTDTYSVESVTGAVELPALDNEELKANEKERPGVRTFGRIIEVDIGLETSGSWTDLPDGGRLWRAKITSPTARAFRFMFDKYRLPVGARLFIYNPGQDTMGAFTAYNNSEDGKFATDLLQGNTAIIEYYEPEVVQGEGAVHIYQISHAYRNPFGAAEEKNKKSKDVSTQGFGDSKSCQVNAECASSSWDDARDATVQLLTSNSTSDAFCSGVMLNNTTEDYTPYVLTAYHCMNGVNPSNTVVRFNYQSPFCNSNYNGPTDQSISGTTLKSSFWKSDFALLELDKRPPDQYDVFLAGWDRSSMGGATLTAMFHHPLGDIKKFSIDNSAPIISGYYDGITTFPDSSHWKVNWDNGSSNNKSSGAPFFNYKGQVIGQHHGTHGTDDAQACDNNPRYGGRLTWSWSKGTNSSERLKDWLDPMNNNPISINGIENDGPPMQPTNLNPTASTPLQLSWSHSKSGDFDHYEVYRAGSQMKPGVDCGNSGFLQIGTTTSKSYTDNEVNMWGNKSCNFSYYVKAVDDNGFESPASNMAVINGEYIGPERERINQEDLLVTGLKSYPNPFNPTTRIQFSMPEKAEVSLQVFNTNGRQIKQLLDKQMTAGSHHVSLNGEDMASGPYLIHLQATNEAGQSIQEVINVHLIK